MEAWKLLVNTALLGTEKRAVPVDLIAGLTGLQPEALPDAEAAFLRSTAILSAYRLGGVEPLKHDVRATPAAAEDRPYANQAAASVLPEILNAGNTGLLRFWLTLARQRGQLIPPQYLDQVLDAAQKTAALRDDTRATAGSRGAWLGAIHPQWRFLTPSTSTEDAWETGTAVERSAYLQQLRHEDAARARELLEDAWPREGADARERLLGTFTTGLSPDDLDFLERASADKSKRVAAQATELLMSIPGSSIVQGFEAWLREAVQLQTTKKLLGIHSRTNVVIRPPELRDKRLLDAVGKTPAGTGESTFLLHRISSHVPPAFWETQLDLRPENIQELLTEAASEVFPAALAEAAARFGDRSWAARIAASATVLYEPMIDLLDESVRERYLKRIAAVHPETVLQYYEQHDAEWLPDLAPLLLPYIASQPYQYGKPYLNGHAWRIPLNALPILESVVPAAADTRDYMRQYTMQAWSANRQVLRDALELKARMLAAFST